MIKELTEDQLYRYCAKCPHVGDVDACRADIDCCQTGCEPWYVLALLKRDNVSAETVEQVTRWIQLTLYSLERFDEIGRIAKRGPYGN